MEIQIHRLTALTNPLQAPNNENCKKYICYIESLLKDLFFFLHFWSTYFKENNKAAFCIHNIIYSRRKQGKGMGLEGAFLKKRFS